MTDNTFLPVVLRDDKPAPSPTQLWREALRGLSPSTLKAYQGDWRRFARWLGLENGAAALSYLIDFPDPFEPRRIVGEYRDYMDAQGKAPNTRARAIRAFNSMIRRVHFIGRTVWTLDVPSGGSQRVRDVRGPSEEIWGRLLSSVQNRRDSRALHDLALIHSLRTLALRATEVTRMRPSHFNAEYRTIAVIGKGNKRAEVEVGPDLWDIYADLIDSHDTPPQYLFGDPQKGWAYHQLYARVLSLGNAIDLKLWPHALRHSGITAAARLNPDIATLQRFSRHDKREVLLLYLDAINDDARKLAEDMALPHSGVP